jgi:hypothetical protein
MIQKTDFIRNLSRYFYHFLKYHMNKLLGDFNAKVGREFQTYKWELECAKG